MKAEYRNSIRSKELIKSSFIQLLKEKPIKKITITDITKRANISRGTFYTHYKDIYDLIECYQKEFVDNLSVFMQNYQNYSLADRLDILIDYSISLLQKDIYKTLAYQDLSFSFLSGIRNALVVELIRGYDVNEQTICAINIYISGFVMFVRDWLDDPELNQLENIKKTLSKLVHQGPLLK